MAFVSDVKQVGVVGALRRSPLSMAYVGLQEVGRMARSPKLYFSDIKPHPSKQVVIVVDPLNGFLGKDGRLYMKKVEDIFPRMNKVINAARDEGIPVIYLCDGHSKKDEELKQWPGHCDRRTWESQVHPKISQPMRKNEWVFKTAFSAFESTNLDEILKELGVEELIILGVATEYCDEANSSVALGRAVQKSVIPAEDFEKAKHLFIASNEAYPQFKPEITEENIDACDISDAVKDIFQRALKRKYKVTVVSDSIREVNLTPGDGDRAVWRMAQRGIHFSDTAKVVDMITRQEYKMPLPITPTDFPIGPSIPENARPIVTEEIVGRQAEYTASLNFRREPFPSWLTETDQYQMVMAYLFRQICHGTTPIAHFEAFIRKFPRGRDFMIFSGLRDFLYWMKTAKMTEERIQYVLEQPIFRNSVGDLDVFADYLRNFRFKLDVWSFREGTPFAPMEPFIGISGPIEQVLLAETMFLSMVNSRSAFSTRAAQYRLADPDIDFLDMGHRRIDRYLSQIAAFEGFLQGFIGTSNLEAGFQNGIDSSGTNSHAMSLAFNKEIDAIRSWFEVYPESPMVLIDTFHALINALKTSSVLQELGKNATSFRADSGNLVKLMQLYERILIAKGIKALKRVGTNDLTPILLAEMREQEGNANVVGVGTKFGEVPATPAVLKLSEIDGPDGSRFICKLSPGGKETWPGIHQTWRKYDRAGHITESDISLLDERIEGAFPQLVPYSSGGYILSPYPTKEELKAQYTAGRESLPLPIIEGRGRGDSSFKWPVKFSDRAKALRAKVIKDIHEREINPYLAELSNYVTEEEIREAMGE
jgi:nicotinate phosphoribosyltransferase